MLLILAFVVAPTGVQAATLTSNQVGAIISVLQAFGVDQATINMVYADLVPVPAPTTVPAVVATTTAAVPLAPLPRSSRLAAPS